MGGGSPFLPQQGKTRYLPSLGVRAASPVAGTLELRREEGEVLTWGSVGPQMAQSEGAARLARSSVRKPLEKGVRVGRGQITCGLKGTVTVE